MDLIFLLFWLMDPTASYSPSSGNLNLGSKFGN